MALYSVMKPEGNLWVRYGRQFKTVTAAVNCAKRWNKAYVTIVGCGKDNGRIVFYNCEKSGHLVEALK